MALAIQQDQQHQQQQHQPTYEDIDGRVKLSPAIIRANGRAGQILTLLNNVAGAFIPDHDETVTELKSAFRAVYDYRLGATWGIVSPEQYVAALSAFELGFMRLYLAGFEPAAIATICAASVIERAGKE